VTGTGQGATYRCESTMASCPGGVAVTCDTPDECPGQVCCGVVDGNDDMYESIQCQDTCDPNDPTQHVLCDPNAVPDACASIPSVNGPPFTCTESTLLPGYYYCSDGQ